MLVFQTQVGKNVNTFFLFKIGSIANGSFFSWVGGHVAHQSLQTTTVIFWTSLFRAFLSNTIQIECFIIFFESHVDLPFLNSALRLIKNEYIFLLENQSRKKFCIVAVKMKH
jgi:hypothetical protein